MAITIRDVAAHAGVSIATVSRVLNNSARVREDKRRRVEEAVKALGFIPNQAARSLVQKKTRGVGVLLPSLGGEFFSEFLYGVDEATRAADHFVLISSIYSNLEDFEVVIRGMQQRVDGLIIMPAGIDVHVLKQFLPSDTPVILINGAGDNSMYSTINFDNHDGAFQATDHLIRNGHRRIAILKGREGAYDSEERLRGYRDALRKHGITPHRNLELSGDYSRQGGYDAVKKLTALHRRPTAVFCANDQSAIGLVAGLQNAGFSVPDDFSVVGFDDIPAATFSSPPLTTIHVGIRNVGRTAIQKLLEQEEDGEVQHLVLPVACIERGSTSPLS